MFQTGRPLYVSDARLVSHARAPRSGRWVDRTTGRCALIRFAPFGSDPQAGDALSSRLRPRARARTARSLRMFVSAGDFAADVGELARASRRSGGAAAVTPCAATASAASRRRSGSTTARASRWEFFDGADLAAAAEACKDRTRALQSLGAAVAGARRWRIGQAASPATMRRISFAAAWSRACTTVRRVIRGVQLNALIAQHAADVPVAVEPGAQHRRREPAVLHSTRRRDETPVVPRSLRLSSPTQWNRDAATGASVRTSIAADRMRGISSLDARARRGPVWRRAPGRRARSGRDAQSRWKVGGGRGGNVPARHARRRTRSGGGLDVAQPFAAWGGADAESLDAREGARVRRPDATNAARPRSPI